MAKTIIHKDNKAFFGDKDHLELSKKASFSTLIFELLSGKSPKEDELKVFELVLNLSIDHGAETPSARAVIEAANKGASISEAVASGIKAIDDIHGGAGEGAMEVFYKIKEEDLDPKEVVTSYLETERKVPGYGHRIYKVDPRAELILETASEAGIGADYIKVAKSIEGELKSRTGKILPVNIDGAMAVIFCAFNWEPRLAKAVFIIARTPGLCGQFLNNE
ncbi:MAG TPA: citrate/2-methylcitrate synthase [Candidatus Paceibacterota bacterium]